MKARTLTLAKLALACMLAALPACAKEQYEHIAALSPKTAGEKGVNTMQNDGVKPRLLDDYITQEQDFYEFLKKNHPLFDYEKRGDIVGKYHYSDRMEEFVDFGGGPNYANKIGEERVAMTYRLGMESILDYPNKFVGPKKCGECHPAQYRAWERSRHSKVIRFPHEIEEAPQGLKAPMYNSLATILPEGIEPSDVFAIVGTPRTKYGFIDKYLVRGTYHVRGGKLSDKTGKIVAGGNQFSRLWAENLTPEMAKKIRAFSPDFPVEMSEFGDNGSLVWGLNSYGAKFEKSFMFQPASSYCEVCHSFKFDFTSKEDFFAALGNADELQKHAISKGIGCEECHGAGAHLYGARGAGMASNCERCHQRFAFNEVDAANSPDKPFNAYFKSACPSCGTEGAQLYSSAHYDKGMRCSTCHDPHEVTKNDWKDGWTRTGLKKTCQDCHEVQASFFKAGGPHAKDSCTGCHMPNMMSCENFAAVQNPDKGGFDNVRASHIWKIDVSPTKKTINPPPGQPRDPMNVKGWAFDRNEQGRFFLDLMWSCARTSFSDADLVEPGASGCHSPVQSTLPDKLKFTAQEDIFDIVQAWQMPVKEGYEEMKKRFSKLDRALANAQDLSIEQKSRIFTLAKQAEAIKERLEKDGSWGVHGPNYAQKIVAEALVYLQHADMILREGHKAAK